MKVLLSVVVWFAGFLVVMNVASVNDRRQARFMYRCEAQMGEQFGYPDHFASTRYMRQCFNAYKAR